MIQLMAQQRTIACDIDRVVARTEEEAVSQLAEIAKTEGLELPPIPWGDHFLERGWPNDSDPWKDHPKVKEHFRSGCTPSVSHRTKPVVGMRAVLYAVNAIVPIGAYISGRPGSLRSISCHWLRRHRFPVAPISHISCKEYEVDPGGGHWKPKQLTKHYPYISGIIDDSMTIALRMPLNYPGLFFLFGPQRADLLKEALARPFIIWCPTPADVLREVRNYYA